jgi:PAS domain S-box-containing protein
MSSHASVTADLEPVPVAASAHADAARAPSSDEPVEALQLLRATLDAAREALVVVNEQGHVALVNQRFAELWPIGAQALAAEADPAERERLLAQVMAPDALACELERLRCTPDAVYTGRLELRDGRVLDWHSHPTRQDGRCVGRLYSFLDVTERVVADSALQQRLRLETSIARIAAALTSPGELDLDGVLGELGRAVDVHRTYIMHFRDDGRTCDNTHEWCAEGVSPEIDNLQGIDTTPLTWWWSSMAVGDPVVINDIRTMPPEGAIEQEFLGAQGIQSLLALPMISREHGLIGFVGYDDVKRPRIWNDDDLRALRVVSDLLATELDRRRAAEALRASEERLTQVLDATTDGFWDWNLDTDRVIFSSRWFDMLHEHAESADTTSAQWFDRVHPDDRAASHAAFVAHLRGETPAWQSEQRIRDGRGEWRWILTRGRVVERDASGRAHRAVGTHTDIASRRQLEEQLRQAQKMEAVGQLAGGIAHDFNNLLTAVIGHAALLTGKLSESDPAHTHAVEIRKAADRAAQLTQQLLAFSRKQLLVPQVLDLSAVVADTELMLSRVITGNIELATDCRPGTTFVRADPGQVQQVLLNLVVNARDAMPAGGRLLIEVFPSRIEQPVPSKYGSVPPGDWVVLAVTDTGEGIDPAHMARIFEPFFTTKEQGKGTGLGLATVYGIVAQSDGHVWLHSEVGIGTSFRIYLPRVEAASAPHAAAPASEPTLSAGSGRILLVEDDPTVRLLVVEVLKASGYTTIETSSPLEALRVVQDIPPVDLILTDMVMPGMDGTELVARLLRRWPGTRVLFMSGYADREIAETGIIEAGYSFIGKPFTPRSLTAKLHEVMAAAS